MEFRRIAKWLNRSNTDYPFRQIIYNPKLVGITFPMELVHNCQLTFLLKCLLIYLLKYRLSQVLVELSSNLVWMLLCGILLTVISDALLTKCKMNRWFPLELFFECWNVDWILLLEWESVVKNCRKFRVCSSVFHFICNFSPCLSHKLTISTLLIQY